MTQIDVSLGERSYPIHIGLDTVPVLQDVLSRLGARGAVAIVTDSNVAPLYGAAVDQLLGEAGLWPRLCVLQAGEENKRLDRIEWLCGEFLRAGLDRSSIVVALGGGVVGDVAGFAAAVYMRGIRFVQVPTTIVAQVDSSVGGKTGVNHPLAKNIIGSFHQPIAVVIDLTLLRSLPDRELRAGLAEVIKHGVIADATLFAYMEANAERLLAKDLTALEYPIRRSCEIKASIVAEDEREQGLRAILNYGHTFGHGFEAAGKYARFLHGEAVALGMHAAAALAQELGLVDEAFVQRQRDCIEAYGLPVAWPEMPVDVVLEAMQHDKKAVGGALKFILADGMAHVIQRKDITEAQTRAALEAVRGGRG